MTNNSVVWFEIYVDDIDRATKFYEEILQVKLIDMASPTGDSTLKMRVFPSDMEKGGASGALVEMEGFGPSSSGTIVYFGSEDCSLEESRVEAAGGNVFQAKMSLGDHGYCTLVSDSEGNTIGIHSMQ